MGLISSKALSTIASALKSEIEQLVVQTVFLYGAIRGKKFSKQLTGQENGSNLVCLLNKALYGLDPVRLEELCLQLGLSFY